MLSEAASHTMHGQLETVNSEDGESRGIPTTVSIKAGVRNTPAKEVQTISSAREKQRL
jgi:hypothetical protein